MYCRHVYRLEVNGFSAAAAGTGMGDRLLTGKPPRHFNKPLRPTQPPTLSGMRNDARRLDAHLTSLSEATEVEVDLS